MIKAAEFACIYLINLLVDIGHLPENDFFRRRQNDARRLQNERSSDLCNKVTEGKHACKVEGTIKKGLPFTGSDYIKIGKTHSIAE